MVLTKPGWVVYKEQMSLCHYGDALWQPAPNHNYDRVKLGDVGYIRRGRFHLLFSAGCPLGGRCLGLDVPETFEPLDVGPTTLDEPRLPGYLGPSSTKEVKESVPDVGASVSATRSMGPGVSFPFDCAQKQGAALVTRCLTFQEDIDNEAAFEEYTKRHYGSWVTFARQKRVGNDIKPVIVTGVDLTKDFAMMAYSDHGTQLSSKFTILAPLEGSGSASVWGKWDTQGLVHTNCGPHPRIPPPPSEAPQVQCFDTKIPKHYDQCVFVRYYSMRWRALVFPQVIKAAAGPHDLGSGDNHDETHPGLAVQLSLDPVTGSDRRGNSAADPPCPVTGNDSEPEVFHNVPSKERDAFDVIAEYVFKNSEAESVLIHHRDITLLRQGTSEAETEIAAVFSERQPAIEVDGGGVGKLVHHRSLKDHESGEIELEDVMDYSKTLRTPVNTELALTRMSSDLHDPTSSKLPANLDEIEGLGRETEPGVAPSKQKVEPRRYNGSLDFTVGDHIDEDWLRKNRSLIHTGKFLQRHEAGTGFSDIWAEIFVLLFDNCLVMTQPKEKDGVTGYQPIPLELLALATFTEPPNQSDGTILFCEVYEEVRQARTDDYPAVGAAVYPCTIYHTGRLGDRFTLFAGSSQARLKWKANLEEAIGLRKVTQESNKVFKVKTLSVDTFFAPTLLANAGPSWPWNNDGSFTGKVTCSVPFSTPDGRALVAIGCAEGVWIGFRNDSQSMRRVLHLRMVTQCAMLEDCGIFLVLADKSLLAYHIEALVPSLPGAENASQAPQKLSGNKDVQFFTVGNLGGRTLVIYMKKKKNPDSVFRVLEPVIGKINEKLKPQPSIASRFGLRSQRSEWFRVYRDFFLPSDSYDLLFLKARIAILCSKGFEIMDLSDFKSVLIPQREDPRLERPARRVELCRPMGIFRSNKDEFLLCYDEFGLYVDKHGDPSRPMGTVEWEGTAERVAWHPPYVLLFNSRFIEIRRVENGRLVQVVSGNDMRCIWDGRGTNHAQAISEGAWDEVVSQEPRVHGVMNMETAQPGKREVTTQHVFELIPTVPVFLPGSLASPSHASYFNQSNSPPQSPKLNPAYSIR